MLSQAQQQRSPDSPVLTNVLAVHLGCAHCVGPVTEGCGARWASWLVEGEALGSSLGALAGGLLGCEWCRYAHGDQQCKGACRGVSGRGTLAIQTTDRTGLSVCVGHATPGAKGEEVRYSVVQFGIM